MEEYNEAVREYHGTIRMSAGCGERGQGYIEAARARMVAKYKELTGEERASVQLPGKTRCSDDGTGGVATGVAVALGLVAPRMRDDGADWLRKLYRDAKN